MNEFKIKIEGDEYDALLRDLVSMAIEANTNDKHILLRILQLLLNGEWIEEGDC